MILFFQVTALNQRLQHLLHVAKVGIPLVFRTLLLLQQLLYDLVQLLRPDITHRLIQQGQKIILQPGISPLGQAPLLAFLRIKAEQRLADIRVGLQNRADFFQQTREFLFDLHHRLLHRQSRDLYRDVFICAAGFPRRSHILAADRPSGYRIQHRRLGTVGFQRLLAGSDLFIAAYFFADDLDDKATIFRLFFHGITS